MFTHEHRVIHGFGTSPDAPDSLGRLFFGQATDTYNDMASQATLPVIEKRQHHATNLFKRSLRPLLRAALYRLHAMLERFAEGDLPAFANEPKNLKIELPRRLFEPQCMHIGDDVSIGPGSLLVAQTHYPTPVMQHPGRPVPVQRFEPRIVIGNRVTATGTLTLDAMEKIIIEDDVMFAANVTVMDGLHGFQSANEPYKYQPMWRIEPVVIGRGCWIAQNVVIMPGVTIGELSIIGANSVVTHSIPARVIAFGNPARVVKRWDEQNQCWLSIDSERSMPVMARQGALAEHAARQ
jgi:acetyltransferase-like isoleucine patch superfamily enzyme